MSDYLTCAETAKLVRAQLKQAFPGVRFAVRSNTYAGGAAIDVTWTDGPTVEQVRSHVDRYAGADFDGMQDLRVYRNTLLDGKRSGADFVQCQRRYSDTFNTAAIKWLEDNLSGFAPYTGEDPFSGGYKTDEVYRLRHRTAEGASFSFHP